MPNKDKLVVMMPALNEAATIADVIERVPKKISGIGPIEVLVVDDGSTDDTRKLAEEAGATVVSHRRNRGVGAAFQTGIRAALEAGADFVVNIDSDGQFSPEDIPKLLGALQETGADCATASRFKDRDLVPEMDWVRFYGNWGMARLISMLTGKRFADVSCGFRAYTRDTLLQMNLLGEFTYTQETFLDLSFKGLHIEEVPIPVQGTREHGTSRVAGNIPRYAYNTSKIIFRTCRDYYPLRVFGGLAAAFFAVSFALFVFLLWHYMSAGQFFPHRWAGFAGAYLGSIGLALLIIGLLADMFVRFRINQERLLYLMRKMEVERND